MTKQSSAISAALEVAKRAKGGVVKERRPAGAVRRSEARGEPAPLPPETPIPRPNPARTRPAEPRPASGKSAKTAAPPSRMRDANPMPLPRPKPAVRTPRDADLGLSRDIEAAGASVPKPSQGARSGPPMRRMPVFERGTDAPSLGSRFHPEPPRRGGPSLGERFTRSEGPRPGDIAYGANSPMAAGISGYRDSDIAGTPRFELADQPSLTTPPIVPHDFLSAILTGRTLTPEQRASQTLYNEMSGPRAPVPRPNPHRVQLRGRMDDAFQADQDALILEALQRALRIRGGG